MTWQDATNGSFELMGSFANWMNVMTLWRDKKVRGVNVWSYTFFASWGFWNLYYYPHLDQWLSFFGGLLIVTANTAWVVLAYRYRNN